MKKSAIFGVLILALSTFFSATSWADESGAVSIVKDPTEVGTPVGKRGPETVKFTLEVKEVLGILDAKDKTTFKYWTFNGTVPGPLLRARVGDTVQVTVKNDSTSLMIHNVDLHAVWGQGGGAAYDSVAPGESKTFTFKATTPGLFVYHCATPVIAQHISSGMYGMILIEPKGGLKKVDKEFYVMQGDIYATGTGSEKTFDMDRMMDENPTNVVFNGSDAALAANPMKAKVGDTIRIFFGVGGPNLTSSFHMIGGIFDKVFAGSLTDPTYVNVQTTIVPAAGSVMVEAKLRVPAKYILVDHSLTRLQKGAVAIIQAEGPDQPQLIHAGPAK